MKHRGKCSRDLSRDITFKNIKYNKQKQKELRCEVCFAFWFYVTVALMDCSDVLMDCSDVLMDCSDVLMDCSDVLMDWGKLLVWYSSTLLPSSFKPFRLSCFSQTRLPEAQRDLKWEHWLRLSSVDQGMKGWWSQSGFGLNDSCWVSKFPRAVFVIIVLVMNVTSSLKRCVN